MKTVTKYCLLLTLAFIIATPLMAEDKEKPKKKKVKKHGAVTKLMKSLAKADLTDEQQEKIKELGKEYGPKIATGIKKAALTKEQKNAIHEAQKKAKEDGLKGKARHAAIDAAGNLSDEQKAALAETVRQKQEFRKAAFALLTDEQKEKVGMRRGKKKKKSVQ